MIVRTFLPRFLAAIKSGQKRQTVRLRPNRMPKVGDTISCRAWTGKPYRSKQERLGDFTIMRVADVSMRVFGVDFHVWVDNVRLEPDELLAFAKEDGFESIKDMQQAFEGMGELPLIDGIVIFW